MRSDPYNFLGYYLGRVQEPRFLVVLEYDSKNIVLTSHRAPKGIAGSTVEYVLQNVSTVSQSIDPLAGRATIGGIRVDTLNVTEPTNIRTYDLVGASYWRDTTRTLSATQKTRLSCWFRLDSTSVNSHILAANNILWWYIATSGELRVYRPYDSAGDSTGIFVSINTNYRADLEWDGDGNYTVWLDGQSYSGTYNTASTGGTLQFGRAGSVITDGHIWDARVYQDDELVDYWRMNEGSGTSSRNRVEGGSALELVQGSPTGQWETTVKQTFYSFLQERQDGSPAETLHERRVRFYVGFTDDIDDYVLVHTSYINKISNKDGSYTLDCADVTKQMRSDIFEPKTFRLAVNLDDGTTSPYPDVSVYTTEGAQMMTHTGAFSESPSETVGYLRVKDTGEIIKYTGISDSPSAFTGITRGVFNTDIVATDGDFSKPFDEWPELEEYIYLEMPAPQLAYAVTTGIVPGTSPTIELPDHWHMGVPTDRVDLTQWENIGDDLWNGGDGGLVLYFAGLKKIDGKQFVESEIHRLIGTYSIVEADGKLGLKRVNKALTGSSFETTVTHHHITNYSGLAHHPQDVVNQYRIDYQWNGEKYLRSFLFVDTDSVSRHGASDVEVLKFKGLHTSRHSVSLIAQMINTLQDRYRNPPATIDIGLLPEFNVIEAGDIIRVGLYTTLDHTGNLLLYRPFEVQRTAIDWFRGRVQLSCFASTGDEGDPLYVPSITLADAFYTKKGTNLTSVLTISAGTVTANGTIFGNANMNASGAVFYYDGDLTIQAGRIVTITGNVQLRIRGTLTINGQIDGAGYGKSGATEPNTVGNPPVALQTAGTSGFVGRTFSTDGIGKFQQPVTGEIRHYNILGAGTDGAYTEFPNLSIGAGDQAASPVPSDLTGIPDDLRGTSGGAGGPLYDEDANQIRAKGGNGGASGAGLCIIARGVAFGANGEIDLSGSDGSAGGTGVNFVEFLSPEDGAAGTGAGGGPGSLLILIDGGAALPDLAGKFVATTGQTNPVGYEAYVYLTNYISWNSSRTEPLCGLNSGYNDGTPVNIIDGVDYSEACQKVMYIPEPD